MSDNNKEVLMRTTESMNDERLAEISKQNLKMIVISVVALCIMSFASHGVTNKTIIGVSIVLFLGGGLTTLCNFLIKDNVKSAIAIMLSGGISAAAYSILMGGSSSAFIVCYVILALASMYYDVKIAMWVGIPMSCLYFVLAIVCPWAIEGPGGIVSGAIAKVVMLIVSVLMIKLTIELGEEINKKSMENVIKLKEYSAKSDAIATELNKSVEESNKSVDEVVSMSKDIGSDTEDINRDVDEITERILIVNNSISTVRKDINNDVKLSDDIKSKYLDVVNIVKEGIDKIDETKLTMKEMEKIITEAYNVTHVLVTYMEEIDKILEEIDNITSQTRLLALNASIESARTGERGKGFAVVADEIRSLSDESSVASNNIKQIITVLNDIVLKVSKKMKESSMVSKEGYNEIDGITEILERINYTSEIVEKIISSENKLINDIGNEFNNIAEDMTSLFGLSEKNKNMVDNIQKNIEEENVVIHNLESKMDYVEGILKEM
ncbi:MAG: hypothetical protein E7262_01830 [Lachnospiraceae bacterium]|nr:hypothetical protein [Lachnospiraceae bacterium]